MRLFQRITSLVTVIVIVSSMQNLFSQDVGITFNGFIKTDVMLDTRQSLAFREGHFYLWPLAEKLDKNGKDLNEKTNFNILNVQSRLQSKITGPEVFGAKSSAYVEMEFFGSADANINTIRLRHAFVDLYWATTKFRAGQFWHPLFNTDCFPGTISFNTGVPFQPFSRNPQLRLVQKIGDLSLTIAGVTQRDFTSSGPDGFSSIYLRNSGIPELFGGLQYNITGFLIGAGGSYKILTPKLSVVAKENSLLQTNETIGTYALNGFTKITSGEFSMKLYGVYGQNLPDLMMPGGYAVKAIDGTTNIETYTPFNNLSVWTDIAYGKQLELGLFAAYEQVLGTSDNSQVATYYGRGTDIKTLMRLSPRIAYNVGKYRAAFEFEYTSAEYGKNDIADKNIVKNTKTVANLRGLLAFYLFF